MESNPYTPPKADSAASTSASTFGRKFGFLFLPPLLPFIVHCIIRAFIPAEETLYHALFLFGATVPAMAWSLYMVDRFKLPFVQNYLLACGACGGVMVSSIMSPTLFKWLVG